MKFNTAVWMVLFLAPFILADSPAAPLCTTRCASGEYCYQDDCRPCPDGQYQSKPEWHNETECIPFSPKPPCGKWVMKREGNATSDRIWECAPGYKRVNLTKDQEACILKTMSTTPSPNTSGPVSPTPTSSTTESSDEGSNSHISEIIALRFLVVVLAIVLFSTCIYYRRKISQFSRQGQKPENGDVVNKKNGNVYRMPDNNLSRERKVLSEALQSQQYHDYSIAENDKNTILLSTEN